jgi:THAP4-like, heme-binding beta-barrel domain
MDLQDLLKMEGDWVGTGSMTIGSHSGSIEEFISFENTDKPNSLSYMRKSRITFPGRVVLHNEIGYMRTVGMGLLLSTGSYEILDWVESQKRYEQVAGSADSRNMVRKVEFIDDQTMVWNNSMEVDHGGNWVSHTTETRFVAIS